MASSFDRLKELNLTGEEVDRLKDAFSKDEFRKLFAEYIHDIQDPKNREVYEQEIKQLERERGQEVTFLHPTPGYVIKTSINGHLKGFINICSNSNINKGSSVPAVKNGQSGRQFSFLHYLSPPHDDVDNKGASCQVFDVLFHPDTLNTANKNTNFRSLLNEIALEAIEKNFNVQLDKQNLKFPKLSYKGIPRASIMRKPLECELLKRDAEEQELFDKLYAGIDNQHHSNVHTNNSKHTKSKKESKVETNPSPYTTPVYNIKHRNYIDIQDYTEDKHAKLNAAIPKELVIEINLPLLKSSSDMELDVTEKSVQFVSEKPAKYKLNLTLPYHVDEAIGTAKFDKNQKKLIIVLPVKRNTSLDLSNKDDSGVETDLNSPLNSEWNDCGNKQLINVINETISKNESTDVQAASDTSIDDFLEPNETYTLPEFTCNVFDNVVAFTFNVKNVDEKSVHKTCLSDESLVKIRFSSISTSFYITNYAFYVKFPNHKYVEHEVSVETWDNNVIFQIPLIQNNVQLSSYFYGSNGIDLIEKFIDEPAIISENLSNNVDSTETQLNTESEDNFLDVDKKYILPDFTCNLFDDILAFTFNVENIIEKSVEKECLPDKSLIKIKFSNSVDVKYDYSFFIMFPSHEYLEEQITIETGANNMILQVPFAKNDTPLVSYLCGLNLTDLKEKYLEEPVILNKLLENSLTENTKPLKQPNCQSSPSKNHGKKQKNQNLSETKASKAIAIRSHSYESSGDELSVGSSSPGKSILKRISRRPVNFGRSISESSTDDVICSSYENHSVAGDETAEGISSSLKKTVRFNDVVSKQLFRLHSSILGQRRKNQRKARNKKRANEHRCSESEASDVDNKKEKEKTRSKSDNNKRKVDKDVIQNRKKHGDDGENIFHLEMNT